MKKLNTTILAMGLVFGIGAITPIHNYQTIPTIQNEPITDLCMRENNIHQSTIQNEPTITDLCMRENNKEITIEFTIKNLPNNNSLQLKDENNENKITGWNNYEVKNNHVERTIENKDTIGRIDRYTKYYIWYGEGNNEKNFKMINTEFVFPHIIDDPICEPNVNCTLPSPIENPEQKPNPNDETTPIGAIIGGIVGGLTILSLIGITIWYYLRNKHLNDLHGMNHE